MSKWTTGISNAAALVTLAGAIDGVVSVRWHDDLAMLGLLSWSPGATEQAYVMLTVGALACLAALNWDNWKRWMSRIDARRPGRRLQGLQRLLRDELATTDNADELVFDRGPGMQFAARQDISLKLSSLKIESPDPWNDGEWHVFLMELVPYAMNGRINEARALGRRYAAVGDSGTTVS